MTAGQPRRGGAPSTLRHVLAVRDALAAAGLRALLFGGWAKELHGVWRGGGHEDIDMLVVAADIAAIDAFLAGKPVIAAKRHVHKRAYWHDAVPVELFHVRPEGGGAASDFYGHLVRPWRAPLGCALAAPGGGAIEVATAANIIAYERDHAWIEEAFYAAFPAIRDEIDRCYGDRRMPYRNFFPS